jgi:hypothetical protein
MFIYLMMWPRRVWLECFQVFDANHQLMSFIFRISIREAFNIVLRQHLSLSLLEKIRSKSNIPCCHWFEVIDAVMM